MNWIAASSTLSFPLPHCHSPILSLRLCFLNCLPFLFFPFPTILLHPPSSHFFQFYQHFHSSYASFFCSAARLPSSCPLFTSSTFFFLLEPLPSSTFFLFLLFLFYFSSFFVSTLSSFSPNTTLAPPASICPSTSFNAIDHQSVEHSKGQSHGVGST